MSHSDLLFLVQIPVMKLHEKPDLSLALISVLGLSAPSARARRTRTLAIGGGGAIVVSGWGQSRVWGGSKAVAVGVGGSTAEPVKRMSQSRVCGEGRRQSRGCGRGQRRVCGRWEESKL